MPILPITTPVVVTVSPTRGEMCAAPWIALISIAGAWGAATVRLIVAEPVRLWASAIAVGRLFSPGVVPAETVAL